MFSRNKETPEYNFDKAQAIHTWTSFPFMDNLIRSVFVCIFIIFIAYLLWELAIVKWDQPLYYVLGIFLMFIGIISYFVPTTYYFFEEGFLVQYPIFKIEKSYKDYGCFYADKMGIMLSTFKVPRRLDSFRGQSIRFSKNKEERESIIVFLKKKIGKQY